MSLLSPHYHRIAYVHSLDELVHTQMKNGVNALCWQRALAGDYAEVVTALRAERGITTLDSQTLIDLSLSVAGKTAVAQMVEDQRSLQEYGADPSIDCVNGYVGHEHLGIDRTDVCSFHADSATAEADTYLCTYRGASSIGIYNEDAIVRCQVPEIRARLLQVFGGADDETFEDYLCENFHDLHYVAAANARTYEFGTGHLWRIAIDYPGNPVPPCIHRAPDPVPGQPARLILIG